MTALVTALLLAASTAGAGARTDVIVLTNGDRVTGEVLYMRYGKLQVKTDDLGTLQVEWDKVASVTTALPYDITNRDGSRLFGRLRPGVQGSMQVMIGEAVTNVPMGDVVAFDAIKSGFLERIDGSLDLGGSYTQSSGVAQVSFDTDARYRRPAYSYSASFAMNYTRQPEAPETSRYSLQLNYTRFRASQWFVSSFGLFESNHELGFKLRGTGAMSLGRYLARSNHVEFVALSGLAAGREIPVAGDTQTNVDLLVGTDLSVFTYDYPTTSLDLTLLAFPSLDDAGRVRLNGNAKFKRELFRNFYFALSAYDAFDNRPKSEGARQNDFGGSVSFGWTF